MQVDEGYVQKGEGVEVEGKREEKEERKKRKLHVHLSAPCVQIPYDGWMALLRIPLPLLTPSRAEKSSIAQNQGGKKKRQNVLSCLSWEAGRQERRQNA